MRIQVKLIATALAAVLATSSMAAPAAAAVPGFFFFPIFKPPVFFFKPPVFFKPWFPPKPWIPPYHGPHKPPTTSPVSSGGGKSVANMNTGKIVVGCIFGSALGLIAASLAKGKAYNSTTVELTQQEAWTIALSCGLGTFPVVANFQNNN